MSKDNIAVVKDVPSTNSAYDKYKFDKQAVRRTEYRVIMSVNGKIHAVNRISDNMNFAINDKVYTKAGQVLLGQITAIYQLHTQLRCVIGQHTDMIITSPEFDSNITTMPF